MTIRRILRSKPPRPCLRIRTLQSGVAQAREAVTKHPDNAALRLVLQFWEAGLQRALREQ